MPNLTSAPMDLQGQSPEPRQATTLASRSGPNSQDRNRSAGMPLSHAEDDAARSARNPFRFQREMVPTPSEDTTALEASPSILFCKGEAVGNQRRPTNLLRLPRYSTLSPAVHSVPPVEVLGPASGINLISPLPQYTARDYVGSTAEKQGMFPPSVARADTLAEKSELRSSPVQEQHPPLPCGGEVDVNATGMRTATPYDDLNVSEEIPHLVAIDTKEYERYKRAYC